MNFPGKCLLTKIKLQNSKITKLSPSFNASVIRQIQGDTFRDQPNEDITIDGKMCYLALFLNRGCMEIYVYLLQLKVTSSTNHGVTLHIGKDVIMLTANNARRARQSSRKKKRLFVSKQDRSCGMPLAGTRALMIRKRFQSLVGLKQLHGPTTYTF